MKYFNIVTTCKDKAEAKNISRILLNNKLIACAQIEPIASLYRWQGEIVEEKEVRLTLKTRSNLYLEVESMLLKHHSYEVPQIIAFAITNGSSSYLKWIETETGD